MRREFELYNKLSSEEKKHLKDFTIIDSIKTAAYKKFTEEEEDSLYTIIDYVINKDSNDNNISTIADKIVRAYGNNEVSLETLENSNAGDILACINWENFEDLEKEYKESEEEEEQY